MNKHTLAGKSLLALAIAAACVSAVPAFAAKIIVLDRTLPPEVKVTGTNFEVDETHGSVRLAVDFYDESFEGNLSSQLFVVSGLTFDRVHREVRYESEGSAVTCALRKKILWGTAYPATHACRVTVRSEPRIADTGFRERAVTGWVVELATNEKTIAAELKH